MWHLTHDNLAAKKRLEAELRKKKSSTDYLKTFRFKRFPAEIRVTHKDGSNQTYFVRMFLNDFSTSFVRCFSDKPLPSGAVVEIKFPELKHSAIRGKVLNSSEFNIDRKIISIHPFPYRNQIELKQKSIKDEFEIKQCVKKIFNAMVRV